MWAYRTGEKEFAHVARDDMLDIRITRSEEKRLRETGAPRRIILRPKPSEWISFKLTGPKDVNEAFKFVELAWKNNGSSSSETKPLATEEAETKPAKTKRKKKEKDGM